MKSVTTIGIDLAKNTFQLRGTDVNGKAVWFGRGPSWTRVW